MITHGTICIEDGTKAKEEFAPTRKVRVEFSFEVDHNATATDIIDWVVNSAQLRVDRMLNRSASETNGVSPGASALAAVKTAVTLATPMDPTAFPDPTNVSHPEEAAAKPAKLRGRPPKKAEALPPVEPFSEVQDAAEIVEHVREATSKVETTEDITDKGVLTVVTAINAKTKKRPEIMAIVAKYCPRDGVPPALKRIPASSRVAFLAEIKALET
jgi:hypothetical protein